MPGIGISIGIGLGTGQELDEPIFEDDMKVQKYTVSYAALSTAGSTNSVTLATLPAGVVLWGVKVKASTPAAGGTLSAYKLTVGIAGELDRYLGKQAPFDAVPAVSATNFAMCRGMWSESHTATTTVKLAATATGDTLDHATAGSFDVWLWTTIGAN